LIACQKLSNEATAQRDAPDRGERGEVAGAVAEGLAVFFRFSGFHQRHSAFLAFVDAKCREHTVFD